MQKKYSWTRPFAVPAQIAGEIIEALPVRTPEALIAAARDKDSPLHACFEWNDSEAAKSFRRIQAGTMINSLNVEIVSVDRKPRAIRAFIRAVDRVAYVNVGTATDIELSREERRCVRAMRAFKERYNALRLAHGVIGEIELVQQQVARRSKKKARAA